MNDTAVKTEFLLLQSWHSSGGWIRQTVEKHTGHFKSFCAIKKISKAEDLNSGKEHSSEFTEHVLCVFVELWDVIMNPTAYVRKMKLREIKPLAEGQRAKRWESLNARHPVLTALLEQSVSQNDTLSCSWLPNLLFFFPLNFLFDIGVVAQTVKNLPAMLETWVRSLSLQIPWRREWQSTPVFLPGESRGQRSLAGYSS